MRVLVPFGAGAGAVAAAAAAKIAVCCCCCYTSLPTMQEMVFDPDKAIWEDMLDMTRHSLKRKVLEP